MMNYEIGPTPNSTQITDDNPGQFLLKLKWFSLNTWKLIIKKKGHNDNKWKNETCLCMICKQEVLISKSPQSSAEREDLFAY